MSSAAGPSLVVYARCPRCQTWVFVGDHGDDECRRWIALRSNPSHEHKWVLIGTQTARCQECSSMGELTYPETRTPTEAHHCTGCRHVYTTIQPDCCTCCRQLPAAVAADPADTGR